MSQMARRCAVLLAALVGGSCAAPPRPPVRIALNAWPGYEFVFLAEQQGYFKAEGVTVELLPQQTLADERRAFERQQVDIVGATIAELCAIRDLSDTKPAVILVADWSNGSYALLARAPYRSVAQLRGRRLALETGGVGVLVAGMALASAGLTFKDITVAPMPQAEGVRALLSGEVDALQTYPPFVEQAMASGKVTRLFDTSQMPEQVVDVLITSAAVARDRADDLGRVLRAYGRAQEFYRANPSEAVQIMAAREKVTPADFSRTLSRMRLVMLDEQRLFLDGGKLLRAINRAHTMLSAFGAIVGPPCGPECVSSAPLAAALRQRTSE